MIKKIILILLIAIIASAILYKNNSQDIEEPEPIYRINNKEVIEITDNIESYVSEDMAPAKIGVYKMVLDIPSKNILVNIYDSITKENLKKGVCWYSDTMSPGLAGVSVICGHSSSRYYYVFNVLKELNKGDEFYIWDVNCVQHIYKIEDIYIVNPEDTWILEQDGSETSKVRLFCCTNNGKQRLVVEGVEYDKRYEELLKREQREQELQKVISEYDKTDEYVKLLTWYNKSLLYNNIDFYTSFGLHLDKKGLRK